MASLARPGASAATAEPDADATSARTRAPRRPPPGDGLAPLDWLIAAGFGLVTLLTRLPLRTTMLAYWDSILYARALDDFNPAAHQPQPPGYIFYVLAARLARALGAADANAAYVWVSLLAAAATVAAIYLVARAIYGRGAGLAAALLAATAVAPWNYSGVAYPYTVLALGSTLIGGLTWALGRRRLTPLLAGLLIGLIGGFRQDLLLFGGPLLLASLGRPAPRRYLAAGLGLALGGLAWLLPSAAGAGGLAAYLASLTQQATLVERDTSVTADGLAGLTWNLDHLRLFLFEQTLLWATLPLAIFAAHGLWRGRLWRDWRDRHLLLWAAPPALFYSLVHLGDVGYVFSLAPPLFIAAGQGAVIGARAVASLPALRGWRLPLPLGLTVTPALVAFALLAAAPALYSNLIMFHSGRIHSALWQECRDGWLREGVATIRGASPPQETLLVAAGYYLHARHYLPEYQAWLADPGAEPVFRRPVPPGVRRVVAYGFRMRTREQPNEERRIVSCDVHLATFAVEPGAVVAYRPDELWIE